MDLVDTTLDKKKIKCLNCDTEIFVYYNEEYKGYRGKCSLCKIDFPLD